MNKEIAIVCIIIALVAIVVIALTMHNQQKDGFDISVDPASAGFYEYLRETNCPKRPPFNYDNVQENGLNPELDGRITLKDYIDSYEQANDFTKPDTADTIAMRYCNLVYTNHRRYFTDKWSGIGDCELDIKDKVEDMYSLKKTPIFNQ
jgi:hypothetical protein